MDPEARLEVRYTTTNTAMVKTTALITTARLVEVAGNETSSSCRTNFVPGREVVAEAMGVDEGGVAAMGVDVAAVTMNPRVPTLPFMAMACKKFETG
jgi:hypothetical protein